MVYIGIDFDRDAGHILTARFAKFSDAGFFSHLNPLSPNGLFGRTCVISLQRQVFIF
ncbi:hypothetical protein LR1_11270 [Lacticaseibacillus rhamnosus DSM 20021 = JCM 1136 = NBRC 3425]|nr:hypothetical protein LR1_11270 [Lacticaseibacillus rhamnosus DSM 20021 = JCM 1136 = NBRC 3425]